jgi:hypothetical protein
MCSDALRRLIGDFVVLQPVFEGTRGYSARSRSSASQHRSATPSASTSRNRAIVVLRVLEQYVRDFVKEGLVWECRDGVDCYLALWCGIPTKRLAIGRSLTFCPTFFLSAALFIGPDQCLQSADPKCSAHLGDGRTNRTRPLGNRRDQAPDKDSLLESMPAVYRLCTKWLEIGEIRENGESL